MISPSIAGMMVAAAVLFITMNIPPTYHCVLDEESPWSPYSIELV